MDLMDTDWEALTQEEIKRYVEEHGTSRIKEFFKTKLERWREVEVNIAITGDSGVGKSSLINAMRELRDDDEGAAEVGITETTREPKAYDHPTNPKIKFWDLPGIGTPNYADMATYCKKVELERFHAFLILTAGRLTENDLKLAWRTSSINKKFFLIRTKIDENVRAGRRKRSFNEEDMLQKIRSDCCENLGDLLSDVRDIFLISNHDRDKWDFARLLQAILNALPTYQRETLVLSLGNAVTNDIFQKKVEVLRGRIWKVATLSAAVAFFPIPGLSIAVDVGLILNEFTLYRSQLDLPEKGTADFEKLRVTTQDAVGKVSITTAAQLAAYLSVFATESAAEEAVSYIPIVGSVIASTISFTITYAALQQCLKAVEETALLVMKEAAVEANEEFD
ncbi:interferon-inducible GTPase 5-like [Porites lutea]|uniref:interferon-inducible GTPase 5-like n=1 Tax=Porites lutea TaxID=51062 RepID=UPI003CC53C82